MLRDVVEHVTTGGVTLHITPLNVFTRKAMLELAQQQHPLPNPKDFEKAVPPEQALYEGQTIFDDTDPAYTQARRRAIQSQNDITATMMIRAGVRIADDLDDVRAAYGGLLDGLRSVGLPLPDDEHEALLLYGVLTDRDDIAAVMSHLEQRSQLSEGEVRDALRVFRSEVRRGRPSGHPGQPGASGTDEAQPVEAEPAV